MYLLMSTPKVDGGLRADIVKEPTEAAEIGWVVKAASLWGGIKEITTDQVLPENGAAVATLHELVN